MDSDLVLTQKSDGVMTVTLNRPDVLNSFNGPMADALLSALRHAADHQDVRAVLLTGAGRAFCAGQDLADVLPADGKPMPDLGASPPHSARGRVEAQVVDDEFHRAFRASAAGKRTEAGEELREGKRLRQVIVRARVEPGDPAVHLRTGGQHQHGHGVAGAAESATHLEAVDAGHEDVEDQRIWALRSLGDHHERRFTVDGELDVIPLELEGALKRLADCPLIVHDKDAHLPPLCARGAARDSRLTDFLAPAYPTLIRHW